ncbi:MAG: YfhO family protein [Vicinamibacterales bacterium]
MGSRRGWTHAALVVAGFTALFAWLFGRALVGPGYFAESDLYEYFLPVFLSPVTTWSGFEFGGMPAFADPGDAAFYPLRILFGWLIPSWTAFIVSAYVTGASGMYAYVYGLTRSRTGALLAGVAFGLSEAMTGRVAHLTTLHTIAWLPLIALAVDRLRGPHPWRWMGLGGLIIGTAFLAGNPQSFLYAGYVLGAYGLVGGLLERAGWRAWVATAGAVALGAALGAVKVLPVLEVSLYTARQTLRLEAFTSYANTPLQALSIFLPSIAHQTREAPTYLGLVTLVCALATLRLSGREWRVPFWWSVAVAALLIGLGEATPVAEWAFQLPFYDRFRVGVRHLIFMAFALSALAGCGVAWVRAGRIPARVVVLAAAALLLAVGGVVLATWQWPDAFELERQVLRDWEPRVLDADRWVQLGCAGLTAVLAVVWAWRPRSRLAAGALVVLLAVDLVHPLDLDAGGLDDAGLAPALVEQPSVHLAALAARAAPLHQRLFLPEGSNLDAVLPGVYARLWRIPSAGGYGPMLLSRYTELSTVGTNGSAEPFVLASDNATLDLLAVRFVVVPQAWLAPPDAVEQDGIRWSAEPLDLLIGPPECGQHATRVASVALPRGVRVRSVLLSTYMRCSEDVPQGQPVARVRVADDAGVAYEDTWRAGIETADEVLGDPAIRDRARHAPAARVGDDDGPFRYLTRLDLDRAVTDGRLEITLENLPGWLVLDRMTVVTDDGATLPQGVPAAYLDDRARWAPAAAFTTSRLTDRGADEEAAFERAFVAFENLRARPRAWLVSELVPVPAESVIGTLHYGRLPDGRAFEPARMAVVEEGTASAVAGTDGGGTADIRDERDGYVRVAVESGAGGTLVLSESAYPGWTARIDDVPQAVLTVNSALLGVTVPPGRHTVEFVFAPQSQRRGAVVSGTALGAIAVLLLVTGRRGRRVAP